MRFYILAWLYWLTLGISHAIGWVGGGGYPTYEQDEKQTKATGSNQPSPLSSSLLKLPSLPLTQTLTCLDARTAIQLTTLNKTTWSWRLNPNLEKAWSMIAEREQILPEFALNVLQKDLKEKENAAEQKKNSIVSFNRMVAVVAQRKLLIAPSPQSLSKAASTTYKKAAPIKHLFPDTPPSQQGEFALGLSTICHKGQLKNHTTNLIANLSHKEAEQMFVVEIGAREPLTGCCSITATICRFSVWACNMLCCCCCMACYSASKQPHTDYEEQPNGPFLPAEVQDKELKVLASLRARDFPDLKGAEIIKLALEENTFFPLAFFVESKAFQQPLSASYERIMTHLRYSLNEVLQPTQQRRKHWNQYMTQISFEGASQNTQRYIHAMSPEIMEPVRHRHNVFEAEQQRILSFTLKNEQAEIFPESNQKTLFSLLHAFDLWTPISAAWQWRYRDHQKPNQDIINFFQNEHDRYLTLLMQQASHAHGHELKKRIRDHVRQQAQRIEQDAKKSQLIPIHTWIALHMISAYLEPEKRQTHWKDALLAIQALRPPDNTYPNLQKALDEAIKSIDNAKSAPTIALMPHVPDEKKGL